MSDPGRPTKRPLMIDTPAGPALGGTFCHSCGTLSFPARPHCPSCLDDERIEMRPLSRRGRLFSYTTAEVGVPAIEAPYSFGFVDLPEGLRIFALLDARGAPLSEGLEMELTVPEGGAGYRFRTAAGGDDDHA